jgi:uncharacterized protein (TIGR02466 family)
MNINLEHWCPKIIGYVDNPDHKKIDKKLIKVCNTLQNKIEKGGKEWVSNKTYNTLGKHNLHEDKNFKNLIEWVSSNVALYADQLNYKNNFKCVQSWFNIYKKYDYQEYHTHSLNTLSAVYFLKSNQKKSSRIFFKVDSDPTLNDPISKSYNSFNSSVVWYEAVPGRLLIFRSNLSHCVERSEENDTRISLAFNYNNQ